MIKAVIFDMDGTILDTLLDIQIAVNHACELMGLNTQSLKKIRDSVGNGAYTLMKRVVPSEYTKEDIQTFFNIYQAYYDENHTRNTGPYSGILDVLKSLKEQGYLLGVVSNKFEHLVKNLNQEMFHGYFDVSIGETKGVPIKPAPDMLYRALAMLDVSKDEAIFVGDSDTDIITAKNANMKSIGVTWGFRDEDVLIKHGASIIIHQPKDLLDLLEKGLHV